MTGLASSSFVIRHWFVIRHSDFVIGPPFVILEFRHAQILQ